MESNELSRVLAIDFLCFCILEYKELQVRISKKNLNDTTSSHNTKSSIAAPPNNKYFTLSKENDIDSAQSPSKIIDAIHLEYSNK